MANNQQVINSDFNVDLKQQLEFLRTSTKHIKQFENKSLTILKITAQIVLFSPALNGSLYRFKIGNQDAIFPQIAKKALKDIKQVLEISTDRYIFRNSQTLKYGDYDDVYKSFLKCKTHFVFRNVSKANGQLDSFFTFIRNSFAHGNFIAGGKNLFLWNFDKDSYKGFGSISFTLLNKYLKMFSSNDNLY